VCILNLSVGLRIREALAFLVNVFGTLVDCVTSYVYPTDRPWSKALIEFSHLEVLSHFLWCENIKKNGVKQVFRPVFEVEQIVPLPVQTGSRFS
jgi:hypothetical protein